MCGEWLVRICNEERESEKLVTGCGGSEDRVISKALKIAYNSAVRIECVEGCFQVWVMDKEGK